jgi:hypothetical protein
MALATPQPIGVIAPAGSRLAGELKRELGAANLASVSMVASDREWPAEMIDLVSIPYLQGVVVGSNDERMIVFSRTVTSGRVEVRFELRFDPNDRPARRRACLAVVEGLRALTETTPPPPPAGEAGAAASAPPPGGAPAATAVALAHASAQAIAPVPVAATATAKATAQWADAGGAPADLFSLPRERWSLGVATMLDLDRALGAPMGHLQFMWFIPVSARVAFRAQAMWPLMGTALGPGATDVRIWTFGAAVGLQYAFAPAQVRVRPFAGVAAGSQLLLTDTSGSTEIDKSRAPFVPSANLRLQSGVRIALIARVQLLIELEATRDWLLQSSRQEVYRDSIANTLAFHSSVGALFEY